MSSAEAIYSLDQLTGAPLAVLEDIYRDSSPVDWQPGLWRGHFLAMLTPEGLRGIAVKWITAIAVTRAPFWIDNDECLWCFGSPDVGIGRFRPEPGPSRWRDTPTVCLNYQPSRLPGLVRRELYDEVKPLTPDLCLCISGINDGPGRGEMFFFALTREAG
jgi:hypothetical protein